MLAILRMSRSFCRRLHSLAGLSIRTLWPSIDGGIDVDGAFLVMEFVDGETLTEVFQHGTLTTDDFIEITTQT